MADKKITQLTEKTAPIDADMVEILDTEASPVDNKKCTKANFCPQNHAALANLAYALAGHTGFQPALGFTAENIANKGAASGYCGLDAGAKVDNGNLPQSIATDATPTFGQILAGTIHVIVLPVAAAANISTGTNKLGYEIVVPFAATIVRARAIAGTAPLTTAIIFDINKNGTTIFTTQAKRLTIAASATSGNTTDIEVVALAAGDRITIDVDQIGTGTVGANVCAFLIIQKTGTHA